MRKGEKMSEEQKQKIGNANRGSHPIRSPMSEETKRKIGIANLGRDHTGYQPTEETKSKISNTLQGHIVSEEIRRKISESLKGKPHPMSEETKKKIGAANKGKIRTPEQIAIWQEKMKGYHHSEETKQKIAESSLGRHHTEESKAKMSMIRTRMPGHPITPETVAKIQASRAWYKHHSEETRLKISEANRGQLPPVLTEAGRQKQSETSKGNQHGLGYRHLALAIDRIGKASLGNTYSLGKNLGPANNKWKGGVTQKNYSLRTAVMGLFQYKQWRRAVYKRDDYTCQTCKVKHGALNAHHIKPFQEMADQHHLETIEDVVNCQEMWDVNNGRTMCKKCHTCFHKRAKELEAQMDLVISAEAAS